MVEQARTQQEFRRLVHECIKRAEELYDVNFGRVTVTFDLKGEKAALAIQTPHDNLGFVYKLRFNRDAMRLDWDQMVSSTIPHEVAHLVAFAVPALRADGHDHRWRAIAINLGDTQRGATYHTMNLPPARRVRRFHYRDERGYSVTVSAKLHREVQAGKCRIASGRHYFSAQHYEGMTIGG